MDCFDQNDFNQIEALVENFKPLGKKAKIIIFGAGINGENALNYLEKAGRSVYAFCDNDESKHGLEYHGKKCLSPLGAMRVKNAVFLVSVAEKSAEVLAQLASLGAERMTFDFLVVAENVGRFKALYEMLVDEMSKKTLVNVIKSRITGDLNFAKRVFKRNQYFEVEGFSSSRTDACFVDCGAYVGDTLQGFLSVSGGTFSKYFAFEPGKKQFEALEIRADRLSKEWALEDKIHCINCGVGEKRKTAYVSCVPKITGAMRLTGDVCSEKIKIVSLDTHLKGENVTTIKADIEGAELDMINGAKKIIKANSPNLAISIYHKIEDFYTIPDAIKNISQNYKFSIRHHSEMVFETVLYCYIQGGEA